MHQNKVAGRPKGLKRAGIAVVLFIAAFSATAQDRVYTVQQAHSHNDYEGNIPFLRAYKKGFGSIEADVFPLNNTLVVAHSREGIDPSRTLRSLYLEPLLRELTLDTARRVSLLVDIKQDYSTSLNLLVNELKPLDKLLSAKRLQIVISGSRPGPAEFHKYPAILSFDDDQSQPGTPEQWERVGLVSLPFTRFSVWNGKGRIVSEEAVRLKKTIDSVHTAGKKIRFWGAPDGPTAWMALMELDVDLIGTDQVEALGTFLEKYGASNYRTGERYAVYRPDYKSDGAKRKVKNIILCIGDGMGITQLYSAYTSNGGQLNIFNMTNTGFSITNAADAYCTDSAAGATAMATGEKTNNRAIGVDPQNKPLRSLLDYSMEAGKKSALIAVCDITDATPAAFYAHVKDRSQAADIARDMATIKADIVLGSGLSHFASQPKPGASLEKLADRGYQVVNSFPAFLSASAPRIAAILPEEETRPVIEGRGPFLREALEKVTGAFAGHNNGFFVMMEGSQIDHGGHNNNLRQVITENRDFDQAVGEALRFADQDGETLVIVTADHETGGLTLLDGDFKSGSVNANFSTNDHTGTPVPVFAYGPNSDLFRGVYPNNEIFHKILKLMGGR
ncbi:alkaline phosphatase [Hufsiella ginkgonis]|uniref:Alkaline phosphatase n=1 Tax=Hufsiella ginkgonis TaxID=2695274 RepID=A0A7K1Y248_9SPHI|nr:alkaline phosphatase [Hufsiella ginkgonis]MXV16756.1 alkaline phosphatase [Hufsiella ginkgonis]